MKKNCILKHCWCNQENFHLCDHNIRETNDLEEIIEEYWKFASVKFEKCTAMESLDGLVREVEEVRCERKGDINQLLEYTDVLFYFLFSLLKNDYTIDELKQAMKTKLNILKQREWKQNLDGTYSHVKQDC